jgi:hypothetical protein
VISSRLARTALVACVIVLWFSSGLLHAADLPVLHIPKAIDHADQEWMLSKMMVSEPQRLALVAEFDAYRREYDALREPQVAALKEFATAVVEAGEPVPQWEELWDRRARLANRLAALDGALMERARQVLAAPQQLGLERAIMRRLRSNACLLRSICPAVSLDVTTLIAELVENRLAQVDDHLVFEEECQLYEQEITQLMQIRAEASLRLRRDEKGFFHTFASTPLESSAFADATRLQNRLYRQLHRAERRIHDVSVQYVDRLAPLLYDAGETTLRRLFQARAYPNIYPSPFEPEPLVLGAIEKLDSDDPFRATLLNAVESWRRTESRIGAAMVDAHLLWMEQLAADRTVEQPNYYVYQDRLIELQAERRRAASELIDAVRELPLAASDPDLKSALTAYDRAVAAHQARRNGTIYFP